MLVRTREGARRRENQGLHCGVETFAAMALGLGGRQHPIKLPGILAAILLRKDRTVRRSRRWQR